MDSKYTPEEKAARKEAKKAREAEVKAAATAKAAAEQAELDGVMEVAEEAERSEDAIAAVAAAVAAQAAARAGGGGGGTSAAGGGGGPCNEENQWQMADSSQKCEFKKFKKSVDEKHEEIIRMYPPHRNSAQGLSLRNIECKPLLQNRRFYQSVEDLSDTLDKDHISSSLVYNERDDEILDYVLNFETHNLIKAHMSFHVKGNPVGHIDNVGAFHLKIDIIIGPQGEELDLESRRSSLIFRFTPILTRGDNKSGQLVFRLSTVAPRGLSFSKEKPLEVLSLVREAGEFRPTIRLPLTDEVLTDIYRIIDIIQKFTFSFDTESGTPRRSGGGGANAAGGGGGGERWGAFAQGRYSSRVANRGGGDGGASAAGGGGGGGGASAEGGGGGGGWAAFAKHGSRYGSNAYKSGSSRPGFGRSRRTRMRKDKKSRTKKLRRSNKSK